MNSPKMYGGKANSLFILSGLGLNVPPYVSIKHDDPALFDADILDEKIKSLHGDYFAVRSSANVEDGQEHSFAGIFKTKLFVRRSQIVNAIREVQKSLHSETLTAYLKGSNLNKSEIQLNVVIQQMINPDISGVAFSTDPNKPYLYSPLISAAHGLGEALVNGSVSGDDYRLVDGQWRIHRGEQDRQLVFHSDRGLIYTPLQKLHGDLSVLGIDQCKKISDTLKIIKKKYQRDVDIEFCFKKGELYILQARPITSVRQIESHIIWDNSNIVESYPGITLPFTFSFILPIYAAVYKNFAALLGVPQNVIDSNASVFNQMLGHIKGRIYYHLINWYKVLSMLPAYQINSSFMEKMMGVSSPLNKSININNPNTKWRNIFYISRTILRMFKLNFNLPKIKQKFTSNTNSIIKNYKQRDYSMSTAPKIWQDYLEFKHILVNKWNAPLVNDFFAMIYFGVLQKLSLKWLKNDSVHTQFIAGGSSVISVQPAILLEKIIHSIRSEDLWDKFIGTTSREIWDLCQEGALGETGKLILNYIDCFGSRSVGELKIENKTFDTHPEMFIDVIKSYHKTESINVQAEKICKPQIRLVWWKKLIYNYILKKANETVADRENLRFIRTLGFGVVRKLIRLIGQRLVDQRLLTNVDDIFYFTEAELSKIISKELEKTQLNEILKQRKVEFSSYEQLNDLPERIHQVDGQYDLQVDDPSSNIQNLQGIPCSPGKVRGNIRILESANSVKSLEGDILVTTSTDPGWITIFRSASAILVERGSTLSHAAIVSREMGIPCIVGIKGLTKSLNDGDLIELDASTGHIKMLS